MCKILWPVALVKNKQSRFREHGGGQGINQSTKFTYYNNWQIQVVIRHMKKIPVKFSPKKITIFIYFMIGRRYSFTAESCCNLTGVKLSHAILKFSTRQSDGQILKFTRQLEKVPVFGG